MVLLASNSKLVAEHALGGGISSEITPWRVLNEAGAWLTNIRAWNWLAGGMEAIATTADQSWVPLPEDFGSIIGVDSGEGYEGSVTLTTLPDLLRLRANGLEAAGYYYWAAVSYDHADITGTSTEPEAEVTPTTPAAALAKKYPTARLELYPTPTASVTGGILIHYERGWRKVSEDTDTIFLPSWLEGVYHRAVRIFARGYEEEESYSKDDALDRLMMGSEWAAAIAKDTRQQTDLGRLQYGAAQDGGHVRAHRFTGIVGDL